MPWHFDPPHLHVSYGFQEQGITQQMLFFFS